MRYRSLIAGLILSTAAFAQLTSFPKPNYFRETFAKAQTKVELQPPAKLKDFVQDGKLELSLKNFLELVMANNTDIQLQKLSLETPKNAIQRAFGAWDPRATAQFTSTRATSPSTSVLEGATELKTLAQPAQFSVTQLLPTGTNYTVSFSGSKNTTNSTLQQLQPGAGHQSVDQLLATAAAESRHLRKPADPDGEPQQPARFRVRHAKPGDEPGFVRGKRLLGRDQRAREPARGRKRRGHRQQVPGTAAAPVGARRALAARYLRATAARGAKQGHDRAGAFPPDLRGRRAAQADRRRPRP